MNNELEKKIRENLIVEIKNSGLKDAEILKKTNLAKNTLSIWKKSIPESIVNYFEIFSVLGKGFDEFVKAKESENKNKNDLIELLKNLDDETILELKGIIKNYLFNVKQENNRKGNKSAI